MNTLQKNWSPFDHLHKFVEKGNPNYITFDNFVKEFPMFKYTLIAMFLNNTQSSVERDVFESGSYQVKDINKARKWANNVIQLKPYFEGYYNKSIFVRALIRVLSTKKEFSFDEFLHKVKLRPTNLVPCGTVEQYVMLIEDIYNYRRKESDKINLRFKL
jgi:hypothetical protein